MPHSNIVNETSSVTGSGNWKTYIIKIREIWNITIHMCNGDAVHGHTVEQWDYKNLDKWYLLLSNTSRFFSPKILMLWQQGDLLVNTIIPYWHIFQSHSSRPKTRKSSRIEFSPGPPLSSLVPPAASLSKFSAALPSWVWQPEEVWLEYQQ